MSLQSTVTFPTGLSYVVKLHRDAQPSQGRLIGRVEHIVSGAQFDFASGEELLRWLAAHAMEAGAARNDAQPGR